MGMQTVTTRSLTESFTFMRNNAFQNRQFFSDQRASDRESLVKSSTDKDVELGGSGTTQFSEWQGLVNSLQFSFSVIRQKMKELITLHDHHLTAANMDSNLDEDQEIEVQTKELTQLFALCHRQLGQLSALRKRSSTFKGSQSRHMADNLVASLARSLQDMSLAFRKAQSQYLLKLKSRDERIKGYLDFNLESGVSVEDIDESNAYNFERWQLQKQKNREFVDQNTIMVTEREQEINQIVRSIYELNEIFRDVAQLVVDQGTLVDRIDYNVELTQMRVEEGLNQLTKARKLQKKNRKMIVIMVLAALVVIFGLILIFTKIR